MTFRVSIAGQKICPNRRSESLGITVKEFVIRFRVSAACHLLADADFKLEHIAELTGFDDASHLSRVFI